MSKTERKELIMMLMKSSTDKELRMILSGNDFNDFAKECAKEELSVRKGGVIHV